MTITEILKDVEYNEGGQQIYAISKQKGDKLICDIRGFGYLCKLLGDEDKAAEMQDEVEDCTEAMSVLKGFML